MNRFLHLAHREKHRGSHPATYPVALVEQAIKFSGITQGVLVDPFMGSGTSAVAAVKCGLDYVGFDVDADYRQFAEDRIADSVHFDPNLFAVEKSNT